MSRDETTKSGIRKRPSVRPTSTASQSARKKQNRRVQARRGSSKPAGPSIWARMVGLTRRVVGPAKGRALRGALALVGAGGVVVAGHFAWRELTRSPMFAIEEIVVTGLVRAPEDEIRELAGVAIGDNALAIDALQIAHGIERHPWVARAQLLRQLPRKVTLEVTEHEPVALVALDALYFVDADGEIAKRLSPGEDEPLPVITGLATPAPGEGPRTSEIRAALAFLAEWQRQRPGEELGEIHVDPSGAIAIVTVADAAASKAGPRVHVGVAPYDTAIERYAQIQAELAARGLEAKQIIAMSARRPDRAVVRVAATAEPQKQVTKR